MTSGPDGDTMDWDSALEVWGTTTLRASLAAHGPLGTTACGTGRPLILSCGLLRSQGSAVSVVPVL